MATTPATPLLHRVLGIGLSAFTAVCLVLDNRGIVPILSAEPVTAVIAYALSGAAATVLAVALFLFKPRVPERRPDQSVEQFWTMPEVGANVLPVWFLLDGAGMIAGVGFLLTAELVSAVAMGVAVSAFWWCGPNVFAKP